MSWLFLAYPLLAHLATLLHSDRLAWLALTVFVALPLLPALRRPAAWAWGLLLAAAGLLYAGAVSGLAHYFMYLPPILIPAAVCTAFGRTLRPGTMPLVTQIATRIRGPLPAELVAYTRAVTWFWTVLLAGLAAGSLGLALFATPELWSLLSNVVLYLLLAAVFLLEYVYRRLRFRHLQHESFAVMVSALFKHRAI